MSAGAGFSTPNLVAQCHGRMSCLAEHPALRSGVPRSPNCRSDMEQIEYESTEVDRCNTCNGIGFDAGEIAQLSNKNAVANIDTGAFKTGEQSNTIDRFPCPGCCSMIIMVDSRQPHIGDDTSRSCYGSFFYAGEVRDVNLGLLQGQPVTTLKPIRLNKLTCWLEFRRRLIRHVLVGLPTQFHEFLCTPHEFLGLFRVRFQ